MIAELREQIAESEPTLDIEFVGIVPDVIGDLQGNPEPIEVKLFSEDAAALQATADEVETAIKKVPGVVDTLNGVVISGPAVTFRIDPLRASQFGVTANDVASTITTAMSGDAASSILQQDRLIKVRVIFPADVRTSLDNVKALQVRSSSGQLFRLDQVADIEIDKGQAEIERENLRQMIAVTGRLEGSDLGTAIRQIQRATGEGREAAAGNDGRVRWALQEQQSSFRELVMALVLAVLLVFITLLIEFRSFAHPIAIVTGAVLALSGVLLALFITGSTLNVVSLMGMIMIVGIVAKNGILMLDAVEEHLAAGDTLREALLRSGRRRFRPVLMTSLAAMLGMLPLALAIGAGSELLTTPRDRSDWRIDMALALSLIVTPTVYAMFARPKGITMTGINSFFRVILFSLVLGTGITAHAQTFPAPQPTPRASPSPSLEHDFFKNILRDQKAIWTAPLHVERSDAKWMIPAGIGFMALATTDRITGDEIARAVVSSRPVARSVTPVRFTGSGAAAGAFYLFGRKHNDYRARETGLLSAEALVDSLIVEGALKEITQRARPMTGGSEANFLTAVIRFLPDTATQAWAVATVIAQRVQTSARGANRCVWSRDCGERRALHWTEALHFRRARRQRSGVWDREVCLRRAPSRRCRVLRSDPLLAQRSRRQFNWRADTARRYVALGLNVSNF